MIMSALARCEHRIHLYSSKTWMWLCPQCSN